MSKSKPAEARLLVTNRSGQRSPCTRPGLLSLAQRVLEGEGVSGPAEISLLYCTDEEIQALNHQYRKKNTPTDVLSFPANERSGGVLVLGDIVISLTTAGRQCASCATGLRDEVRLLFCHGLLHLLGHDHRTKAEENAMIALQAHYLGVEKQAAWRHADPH